MNGTLTINKAPLTVSADSQNRLYGAANPVFTQTVTGFVNGETLSTSGVRGTATGSSAAGASTGVGTASIVASASGLSASNYDFTTLNNGTLTIDRAPLTVRANNFTKTYGETPVGGELAVTQVTPSFITVTTPTEFTTSGLLNAETIGSVSLTSAGAIASAAVAGGPYAVTPSAAKGGTFSASNYAISYVNGSLTVNKAPLTLTADNQSRRYGAANPTFTQTVSGFVNGETLSTSGVSGTATGSSAASASTGVGTASIVASASGLSASNYDFTTLNNGTLTIDRAPLTVTADAANIIFNGQPYSGGNGVSYSGFVNNDTNSVLGGTLAYGGSSQGARDVGSYVITPTGFSSGNYALSYANGTLTVGQSTMMTAVAEMAAIAVAPASMMTSTTMNASAGLLPSMITITTNSPVVATTTTTNPASVTTTGTTVAADTGAAPPLGIRMALHGRAERREDRI